MKYTPLEKININKPVNRIDYIVKECAGMTILDVGCYDETALKAKKISGLWLHRRIANNAKKVLGIDTSKKIKGLIRTSNNSTIQKMDIYNIDDQFIHMQKIDCIVAGELIEHLSDIQLFLKNMKKDFKGKILILSTPNATSLTNIMLSFNKRESTHKDHVHIFSFKTLSTICRKSGVSYFEITPYYVKFTEMEFRNKGIKKIIIKVIEKFINFCEYLFPLTSGGYVVKIHL